MSDTAENPPDVTEETGTEEKRYESEVENVGPCKVEVKIRVPVATIRDEFDQRYKEIIRTVAFPGFRLGHAPRKLVERKLGEEVAKDVKEHVLTESLKAAFEEHELHPIVEPEISLDDVELGGEKPIEYRMTVLVRPGIELPDYETITVEPAKAEVPESLVDEVIEGLRKEHGVLEPVPEGHLEAEGVAVVDVDLTIGDEPFLKRENIEYHHPADRIGGIRLKSLPESMLGKAAGDEITVTETLSKMWPIEFQAGKEVSAKIRVQDVKRLVLPELDDEFVKRLDYDTVDEFRADTRTRVERQAEVEAAAATDRRILDALIEATPFDLPEDIVSAETSERMNRIRAMLRLDVVTEKEFEEKVAEAQNSEQSEVEADLRRQFVMDAVAREEKIFVTESEVSDRISQMAAAYHRTQEEMEQYLEQSKMLANIRSRMREEKVIELLRKKVKIEGDA